jgi:dephospho-CoA kinase
VALHVFALTGGIGSGKSTVAEHFRALGLPVVDADRLARQVVEPGSAALGEIEARFGADVLDAGGRLDRSRLAAHVFGDDEARRGLEAILHPRIRQAAQDAFAALEQSGARLACYDVPLLFETRQEDHYRPVVVVQTSPEMQLSRAIERDKSHADAIRARIAAQLPLAEKARRADYVIDNDGTREATREQAARVLADIQTRWVKKTSE